VRLILASTSRYRRAQLERLGLPFEVVAPVSNEADIGPEGRAPEEVALLRAAEKAGGVERLCPGAIVIGSDQLVDLDGRILGKPETRDTAFAQLRSLSGRAHRLITAAAVCQGQHVHTHVDTTTLWMRTLTDAEIEHYIEADDPLDCAGTYKIESRGITLFEKVETADPSAIQGLPMIGLVTILRRLGLPLP
jgi:septum formation protein